MPKLYDIPALLNDRRLYHGFHDDFENNLVSGDGWTPYTTDMTTPATQGLVLKAAGGVGGIFSMTPDAAANKQAYLARTVNQFLIAVDKPLYVEALVKFSEANANQANVCLALLSTAAGSVAGTMQDSNAGPVATATMAMIYKLGGANVWRCRSQIGAGVGQSDTITNLVAGAGGRTLGSDRGPAGYQRLGIEVLPQGATQAEVIYYQNGEQMTDANGVPLKHLLTYTNALTCGVVLGVKNGSSSAETLLVDYVSAVQKR